MPPNPPRRTSSSRRPASRPPPRKSPPPVLIILALAIPTLGLYAAWKWKSTRAEEAEAPQQVREDPNLKLNAIKERFNQLIAKTTKGLQALQSEPESKRAKGEVQTLKREWNQWRDDFDAFFAPMKNPDGSWPPQYQGYSSMRSQAGIRIQDLIRVGDL